MGSAGEEGEGLAAAGVLDTFKILRGRNGILEEMEGFSEIWFCICGFARLAITVAMMVVPVNQ